MTGGPEVRERIDIISTDAGQVHVELWRRSDGSQVIQITPGERVRLVGEEPGLYAVEFELGPCEDCGAAWNDPVHDAARVLDGSGHACRHELGSRGDGDPRQVPDSGLRGDQQTD